MAKSSTPSALNLGGKTISPKQKKTIITVLVALVVIIGGCFAYHFFVSKPADEKAQAQITEALAMLSQANANKAQVMQSQAQAQQLLDTPDSTLLKDPQVAALTPDSAKNLIAEQRKQAKELLNTSSQQINAAYTAILNGNGKFQGLLKIAAGSGSGANQAKALAGIAYYQMGQYKEAIKQLEDFSPKGDAFSATALSALANCYACDKQIDKAVETFKAAAEESESDTTTPFFLIEAGKLLESQNKKADAHALYEQVKKDYPAYGTQDGSGMTPSEVDRYLERTK